MTVDTGLNTQTVDEKENSWFQTFTGVRFYPWRPTPEMIVLKDIAHHTALSNRWAGATESPLPVAQHLFLTYQLAAYLYPDDLDIQKWALFHDAGEAYVSDMVRPIKKFFPEYQELENKVLRAIAEKFGLCWPIPPEVQRLDNLQLAIENKFRVKHVIPGLYEDLYEEFVATTPEKFKNLTTGPYWFIPESVTAYQAEIDFLIACQQVGITE